MDRQIRPSKRLCATASLLPSCDCITDVGCDHGKLGLYLLLTNRCHTIIAIDRSVYSLQKARRLFIRYGAEQRASFLLHNGLPAKGMAQAAAIAGVGGINILEILKDGKESAALMQSLVLQPSSGAAKLRQGLVGSGFAIDNETIVYEGKYFPVMAVHYDGAIRPPIDTLSCELGPFNMAKPDQNVIGFADWRIRVLEKAVRTPAQTETGRRNQQAADDLLAKLKRWRKENGHASVT